MVNNSTKKTVMIVVGARPNLVKAAPLLRALENCATLNSVLVHTGQHYDQSLSEQFFIDLGIRKPDDHLGVGSDTPARQTAAIMTGLEMIMKRKSPDAVLVVGDVNSTLAAAIVAKKEGILLGHVEAGLRSFDWTMPEEVNRRVTDTLSDLLFVTERSGIENLCREGHPEENIFNVGNVMIDSLLYHRNRAEKHSAIRQTARVDGINYAYVTIHRPSNVDKRESLESVLDIIDSVSQKLPIVFPCHPRTRQRIQQHSLDNRLRAISQCRVLDPVGYDDSIHLQMHASVVLTDSGGIQEETTALGVPCLTLRENTERPITVDEGTNTLVGLDRSRILTALDEILTHGGKRGKRPELWDGHAAKRIVAVLENRL